MAFKNEKSFGFRKAKNLTTIVGTPVGSSVKKSCFGNSGWDSNSCRSKRGFC